MFMLNHLTGFNAAEEGTSGAVFSDCVNIVTTGTKLTGGGYAGYTVLTKINPAALTAGGSICRITMYGPATAATNTTTACWIGPAALSGNAFNFDGTQVQVLFGGAAGLTLGQNAIVPSDDVAFAINLSRSLIVAWQAPSSPAANSAPRSTGMGANYTSYIAPSVQEAGTTLKVGSYTATSGEAYSPFKIEVA